MSNMETGRKAGGSGPPFTAVIIIVLLVLAGMFVWRVMPDYITYDKPALLSDR
jgi:hypothetical protein